MAKKITLRALLAEHTDPHDDLYVRLAIYPFAIPVTWCLLSFTTVSANAVTIVGLALGVAGSVAGIVTQQLAYLCVGFFSFFVCDFVDGQVASVRGGTYLGAMLDLIADRTVWLSSIFCLALHHVLGGQPNELFLLVCYLCLFTYLDALFLAKKIAASKHAQSAGRISSRSGAEDPQTKRPVWRLFPSRLTSPLLFTVSLLMTDSFVAGYYTAIGCVLSEYIVLVVKTGLKHVERDFLSGRQLLHRAST